MSLVLNGLSNFCLCFSVQMCWKSFLCESDVLNVLSVIEYEHSVFQFKCFEHSFHSDIFFSNVLSISNYFSLNSSHMIIFPQLEHFHCLKFCMLDSNNLIWNHSFFSSAVLNVLFSEFSHLIIFCYLEIFQLLFDLYINWKCISIWVFEHNSLESIHLNFYLLIQTSWILFFLQLFLLSFWMFFLFKRLPIWMFWTFF